LKQKRKHFYLKNSKNFLYFGNNYHGDRAGDYRPVDSEAAVPYRDNVPERMIVFKRGKHVEGARADYGENHGIQRVVERVVG
jgi:hypothetical protein